MKSVFIFILINFILTGVYSLPASAKPTTSLVIEHTHPKTLAIGISNTITITFTSKKALQRLQVSATPYRDLTLVSGGEKTEFNDLQAGESRNIDIETQLLKDTGYLSVFATTTDLQGHRHTTSIAIRYTTGNKKNLPAQSPEASRSNSRTEKLILMPAEIR